MLLPEGSSKLVDPISNNIHSVGSNWWQNIPRGKGVERDTRADNPFIDTVSLGLPSPRPTISDHIHRPNTS